MKIKGKIMIRDGNENQPPAVVYVSHFNPNFDWWVTPELNTSTVLFTKEKDLIPFEYKLFMRMYFQWKIDNQPKITESLENLLSEYQ